MRLRVTLGLLLVLSAGLVLVMRAFGNDIAQAAATKQSIAALAPPQQPSLRVEEQNIDGNGNIKVHEQGTAQVSDIGSPTREPARYTETAADIPHTHVPPVPDGKRFIATYITVRAVISSSSPDFFDCALFIDGHAIGGIPMSPWRLHTPTTVATGSESVFIVLDAGEALSVICGDALTGSLATVGGYYIPAS